MYKVFTIGKYLINAKGEKLVPTDLRFYSAKELTGFYSPVHRVLVTDVKTGNMTMLFPGQKIKFPKKRKGKKDA